MAHLTSELLPAKEHTGLWDRFLFVVEKTWRCFQKVGILLISVS